MRFFFLSFTPRSLKIARLNVERFKLNGRLALYCLQGLYKQIGHFAQTRLLTLKRGMSDVIQTPTNHSRAKIDPLFTYIWGFNAGAAICIILGHFAYYG